MRLLNTTTRKLESFDETFVPFYAILSHTWGADEVSFQDIQTPKASQKEGYAKIEFACQEAIKRLLGYVWVDTCCIDKTSSAELSEAINSMFKWYADARECYVYMADVPSGLPLDVSVFQKSRWFTRGWTLQELLAPSEVYFFAQNGDLLGTKYTLGDEISTITKIAMSYLSGVSKLHSASVSCRMSWASSRVTTRTEDLAYCLLGIFSINMPLLYGEGSKAFIRLQEEILKVSTDQTIFTWDVPDYILTPGLVVQSPFALSPEYFRHTGHYIPDDGAMSQEEHYLMTNRGLSITLPLLSPNSLYDSGLNAEYIAILACRPNNEMFTLIGIPIASAGTGSNWTRVVNQNGNLFIIDRYEANHLPRTSLVFRCRDFIQDSFASTKIVEQASAHWPTSTYIIRKLPRGVYVRSLVVTPKESWDHITRTIAVEMEGKYKISKIVIEIYLPAGQIWTVILHPPYGSVVQIKDHSGWFLSTIHLIMSLWVNPLIKASQGVVFESPSMGQLLIPLDIEDRYELNDLRARYFAHYFDPLFWFDIPLTEITKFVLVSIVPPVYLLALFSLMLSVHFLVKN